MSRKCQGTTESIAKKSGGGKKGKDCYGGNSHFRTLYGKEIPRKRNTQKLNTGTESQGKLVFGKGGGN